MSITLIVGDVHLGKGTSIGKPGVGGTLNSRILDQMRLLDWIIDNAIDAYATDIILTGDICEDPKPDYILMSIFIQWLKKCENHNIHVHIIVGNHDIKRSGNNVTSFLDLVPVSEIPNATIYKQIETIYVGQVGFTLIPYRDRRFLNCESNAKALEKISETLVYELNEIPLTYDKVVVGHLTLEGAIAVGDEFDDTVNELMCPVSMFQGYDYVWMGHVHKPQVRSSSPHVAHVGSLDLSDFGETDHTKIIVVFDSDSPEKFRTVKVPSRPLRRVRLEITTQGDTTQFVLGEIDKMNAVAPFKDALVKIELSLMGADIRHVDRVVIEKAIYGYGAFHISSFSEAKRVLVIPMDKRTDLDDTVIDPKVAIRMYANFLKFDSDEEKGKFIEMCNGVVAEEKSKYDI